GPLGAQLKKNLREAWWQDMIMVPAWGRKGPNGERVRCVPLETRIIQHPKVWEASGHVGGFSDPMVDCKESKQRYRADQLFFAPVIVAGEIIGYVSVLEDAGMQAEAEEQANSLKRKLAKQGALEPIVLK